ncbi:exodeoxyribonuclease VII small subunit [Apilactobacillus timberlakei]|uniref:Exodeoxyribonuclease 7 small subunit n=1 Tax=Apilactobacillus timberlakei TaxID=2008380 RepID=A0ABY2YTQ2_9LACO|nr:exodeoxyribonuclease VII small subunit [Apilactobacillus timberlakei]TPR13994.1 exodeoxyribonuclease VII small subunit [Apilactobacillus timberlakei]TPR15310.1 exodeoxyribonuclease VII small subunit [Apilactobacillus timberlakei]TPR16841.1 exodeoxyribonuclease VII small subunit [Apilactobacillus timberlakei]TPR17201.1 exodeoxyribonuclease VII small subunit [Apilactobacillus timberlakei]TPR24105.1 exodeoxyribonuclease VII small subunit [Apilactobacillus timberlakei]
MAEKVTFEENMQKLEQIVNELEQGDIPLEKALLEFQNGVSLTKDLQATLKNAENTLAKEMTSNNEEIPFEQSESDKN